jgi:hypothetical protein
MRCGSGFQFQAIKTAHDNNAEVAGIELVPQWGSDAASIASVLSNPNGFQNLFFHLLTLGQQAFTTLPARQQLRLADNEVQCLSIPVLIYGDDQVQNGKLSSLILSGNRLTNSVGWTCFIQSVTRCLLFGNQIVNEARVERLSLSLDDSALTSAEIALMANVLQSGAQVIRSTLSENPFGPYPNPDTKVPSPLTAWSYLNTQVL